MTIETKQLLHHITSVSMFNERVRHIANIFWKAGSVMVFIISLFFVQIKEVQAQRQTPPCRNVATTSFSMSGMQAQAQNLTVHPPSHSLTATIDEVITIEFPNSVSREQIQNGVFIYGNQSGRHRFDDGIVIEGNSVFITTDQPFKTGELVSVIVQGYHQWQFNIAAETGTGTFSRSELSLTEQSEPISIFAADLNKNFLPDLAVLNTHSGMVTILENTMNGSAPFSIARQIALQDAPSSNNADEVQSNIPPFTHITGGDFYGTGYPSLVFTSVATDEIIVLTNQEEDDFVFEQLRIPSGEVPIMSAVADFNNDGSLDIAVAAYGSNQVVVHTNQGLCDFLEPEFYSVGQSPTSIVARDFNSNGLIDIAVAISAGNRIDFMENDGQGGFKDVVSTPLEFSPELLAEGNFTGNGSAELAVTSHDSSEMYYYRFTQNGTFELINNIDNPSSRASGLTSGDFFGNNYLDLLTSHRSRNQVGLFLNNGNEGFTSPSSFIEANNTPVGMAIADFDLDGDLDIAVTNLNSGQITFLFNEGERESCLVSDGYNFGPLCPDEVARGNVSLLNQCPYRLEVSVNAAGDGFSTNADPFTIEPDETVNVQVELAPEGIGEYQGELLTNWQVPNSAIEGSDSFPLTGSGNGSMILVSPDTLYFDTGVQQTLQVTIDNSGGNSNGSITSIANTNPAFQASESSINIAPGAMQTIDVTFTPAAQSEYLDYLVFESSDGCITELPEQTVVLIANVLPDLVAENLTGDTENIFEGQTRVFTGTFSNRSLPVNSSFRVAMQLSGTTVADTTINGMDVDEELTFSAPVTFNRQGNRSITLVVDIDNEIEESDYENNETSLVASVRQPRISVRPNPFTPNDDGYNDRVGFNFADVTVQNPVLKVFDFQGRLIRTYNQPEGQSFYWDGKSKNGQIQLPGVYLYVIEDGSEVIASGAITLAR